MKTNIKLSENLLCLYLPHLRVIDYIDQIFKKKKEFSIHCNLISNLLLMLFEITV
jgi:hypothetical protein